MHFSDFTFCTRMKKAEEVFAQRSGGFVLLCSGLSPTQVKALPVWSERAPDITQTQDERSRLPRRRKRLFFPPFAVTVHGYIFFFPSTKEAAAPCDAECANEFAAT